MKRLSLDAFKAKRPTISHQLLEQILGDCHDNQNSSGNGSGSGSVNGQWDNDLGG